MMKRTFFFFGVSFRRCCESSVFRELTGQLQLLQHQWLDYCDVEWFALEMHQHHSVIFELAPKYCISDSLVDYEGYSISSKGFLPTVVDIMVIC